jgi:hypothetical protein
MAIFRSSLWMTPPFHTRDLKTCLKRTTRAHQRAHRATPTNKSLAKFSTTPRHPRVTDWANFQNSSIQISSHRSSQFASASHAKTRMIPSHWQNLEPSTHHSRRNACLKSILTCHSRSLSWCSISSTVFSNTNLPSGPPPKNSSNILGLANAVPKRMTESASCPKKD